MYGYKVDIHNYFNSINIPLLLNNLKADLPDLKLYLLFEELLLNRNVQYKSTIVQEQKGAMASTPTSVFLANYYIKEIDEFFWAQKLVYFRYADDIIIFCNTKEQINRYKIFLNGFFNKYKLTVNAEKEYFINSHQQRNFLGFSFYNNAIDLSKNSIKKIREKFRRSAKGIHRWMLRKNADYKIVLKAMNRKYNQKFYGSAKNDDLYWKYWFFSTITTDASLKIIDNYMQENLMNLGTEKKITFFESQLKRSTVAWRHCRYSPPHLYRGYAFLLELLT